MATAEDIAHAQRLLKKYKGRLRVRELQKATQGDSADPAIDIEIEELKASIADLEQHQPSELIVETRQAIRKQYDNDIDFLIADGAARNRRQTRMEEQGLAIAQEVHAVKDKMLAMSADVQDLKDDKRMGERGRRRNLVLLIAGLVISLFTAGGVVALWFIIVRAGVL